MKMGQYTEKLEEVTEQLFKVNDFRKKHGAVGRPLDELESACEVVLVRRLWPHGT